MTFKKDKDGYVVVEVLKEDIKLYPHQEETIEWMKKQEDLVDKENIYSPKNEKLYGMRGGIINLDMGMGKTLVCLYHIFNNPSVNPSLIICSVSVINMWKKDGIEKFYPRRKVLFITNKNKTILDSMTIKDLRKYKVVITTYETCGSVIEAYPDVIKTQQKPLYNTDKGPKILYSIEWERIICDESQKFANPKTLWFKSVMLLCGKYKWCSSGTVIRNKSEDMLSQFRFLGYNDSSPRSWTKENFEEKDLGRMIFTRLKNRLVIKLPDKIENEINLELKDLQLKIYNEYLEKLRETYEIHMTTNKEWANVLTLFTRLRQCAIAPSLLLSNENGTKDDIMKKYSKDLEKNDSVGIKSEKIRKIVDLVNNIPQGDKVVIFSFFSSCLDLIERALGNKKILKLTGKTKDREKVLHEFKNYDVLLSTYSVGGEGLNLVEANHCILVEPWWTNAVHDQAKARCWRTGQTKEVFVYNLYCQDTIEKKILEICKKKTDIKDSFLEKGISGASKKIIGEIIFY